MLYRASCNAKVGKNVGVWRGVISENCKEVEIDSGRRLLGFSAENDLKIMNTHKRIHKFTWNCPGRGLQYIIDYILVRTDQKRYVHDVRVTRGAEIE